MSAPTFVLIDESAGVTGGDTFAMAAALEINARHLASAWDIEPVAVDVWSERKPLPPDHWPIYFVDETTENPGALAVHYVDGGRPVGRVYVGRSSGLASGRRSLEELASHELLEMRLNPYLRNWRPMPFRPGMQVAFEDADPVQDHYIVEHGGVSWRVANFITPAWFDEGAEGPYDHLGTLSRPGEVGPEGYVILADQLGQITYESAAASKVVHFNIRTSRLLGGEGRVLT